MVDESAEFDVIEGVVVASLPAPGSTDRVVLLDPAKRPDGALPWHPFPNVLRVSASGEVRWRSELVPGETTAKCWVSIEWAHALTARTFSYECDLDPSTGRIVETRFTK